MMLLSSHKDTTGGIGVRSPVIWCTDKLSVSFTRPVDLFDDSQGYHYIDFLWANSFWERRLYGSQLTLARKIARRIEDEAKSEHDAGKIFDEMEEMEDMEENNA